MDGRFEAKLIHGANNSAVTGLDYRDLGHLGHFRLNEALTNSMSPEQLRERRSEALRQSRSRG